MIICFLLLILMLLNFYFHFYRNDKVLKERNKILYEVYKLTKQDIYLGLEWEWRYK